MKIAVFSTKSYDREYLDRYNRDGTHELTYFEAPLHAGTINLTQGFKGICAFVNDDLSEDTIEGIARNGVKLIALRCAGFNNVDLLAADKLGMTVMRVPAYSPHSIAEHALALILTLNRKTHKAYNRIRENNFSLDRLTGFNLYQKTIGVIGTGKTGSTFCEIMLGLGCYVVAYDPLPSDVLTAKGVKYCDMDELLSTSDIISLHCPLTPQTHHLINRLSLIKMKKGVMLINTGRGALIHTKDVIDALKSQHIGYLGIDVYEQEENLFFEDLSDQIISDDLIARLTTFPNVLITAHQGFFTTEALSQIAQTTLQNITDFEQNIASPNVVSHKA